AGAGLGGCDGHCVGIPGAAETAGRRPGGFVLMAAKTPLAWLNLTHHKGRFALSLAGVGFAVVLMFVEAGFYNALLDSTVALIDSFDADLVIVSKVKTTLQAWGGAPRRRLGPALRVPGVTAVSPLYLEGVRSIWRSERTG